MNKGQKGISFQEMIKRLNDFWAEKGCVIAQPYGIEVGAGTANPHTFLRALGPEPFNVAYVEPSRRPDDGRYGVNPNRLQHYYQYQVILKPAPANNQELYIEMLKVLGIEPEKHDLRFVEDNWESPAIGAWGLGWEIWLDGMEISQYTYFQQVAGTSLDVPALELTLGLERMAMYIQEVDDFKDVRWNGQVTYGELFEKHEYWQSKHNYETSDVHDLGQLYELNEKQIEKQLGAGNYWAAYDYLLKVSHLFNLLDSRGVISVTDRIAKFGFMGKMAKEVGKLYLEERDNMGYPLSNGVLPVVAEPKTLSLGDYSSMHEWKAKTKWKGELYILEIGLEEMPAPYASLWAKSYEKSALIDLACKIGFEIDISDVEVFFTPRRIVVQINKPASEGIIKKEIKGPAFKEEPGSNDPVLLAFSKKFGVDVGDVEFIEEIKDGNKKYIARVNIVEKHSLCDLAQSILKDIFDKAPKKKFMRWNEDKKMSFIRPLRWLFSYHNNDEIKVDYYGVNASNITYTPRYFNPAIVQVNSAQEYLEFIDISGIVLDHKKREQLIQDEVQKSSDIYEYSKNCASLIDENVFLTESPVIGFVKLEEKFMKLPIELINKVLEKNQRYLMRWEKADKAKIEYGVIANIRSFDQSIIDGNYKVVRARLEDAVFYYNGDMARKLEDMREDLKSIMFHPKLGSYYEKVERVSRIVENIYSEDLKMSMPLELVDALKLIKNDRASGLVNEFASLEGVIGSYYAKEQGWSHKTAALLRDHYLPTSMESELPQSEEARILSLADKMDTIVSMVSAGELPQGSNDPYEIRRHTYSLIKLLSESGLALDVYKITNFIAVSVLKLEAKLAAEVCNQVKDFMNDRIYQIFKEMTDSDRLAQGCAYAQDGDVAKRFAFFGELKDVIEKEGLGDVFFDTIKRVGNILGSGEIKINLDSISVDSSLLQTESENALWRFISDKENAQWKARDVLELGSILEKFFDETMVNVEDINLKANRLKMLKVVDEALGGVIAY